MRKTDSGRYTGRYAGRPVRVSAYLLGVVLLATTLSSCSVSVEQRELENALNRCEALLLNPNGRNGGSWVSICSAAQWEKIEDYAERTGQDVERVRRIRDYGRSKRETMDRAILGVYLDLCADGNRTWHCRSGGVWGFDYLEAIAEKEGTAEQLRELRAIREALEREATPQDNDNT